MESQQKRHPERLEQCLSFLGRRVTQRQSIQCAHTDGVVGYAVYVLFLSFATSLIYYLQRLYGTSSYIPGCMFAGTQRTG